jgi:hypothetical protein
MTALNQALLALANASGGSACVAHGILRDYRRAGLVAAGLAVIMFQVGLYLQLGHLDPFAPIAFVITGGIAYVVALVIGLPFRAHRAKRAREADSPAFTKP